MRRVYPKDKVTPEALDMWPVELGDGRVVLLTGDEWYERATEEKRQEFARTIAFWEEPHDSR